MHIQERIAKKVTFTEIKDGDVFRINDHGEPMMRIPEVESGINNFRAIGLETGALISLPDDTKCSHFYLARLVLEP